jgi:hypothetical protein
LGARVLPARQGDATGLLSEHNAVRFTVVADDSWRFPHDEAIAARAGAVAHDQHR